MSKSVDLTTLSGYSALAGGTYNIGVKAVKTGYAPSVSSPTVSYTKPTVLPFTFSGTTLTAYTGSDTSVEIPSSYSTRQVSITQIGAELNHDGFDYNWRFIFSNSENFVKISFKNKDTSTLYEYNTYSDYTSNFETDFPDKSKALLYYIEATIASELSNALVHYVSYPLTISGGTFGGSSEFSDYINNNSVTSITFGGTFSKTEYITGSTYSVTTIGASAFASYDEITSIIIPNTITTIDIYAFASCESLSSITIPSNVTSIGAAAFRYCTALTSINIPANVTSIGSQAFANCTNLATITVDSNNTTYNDGNGSNCIIQTSTDTIIVGCKNTTIPSSVTTIGQYAFMGCSGLTSITIPSNVTTIGQFAFNGTGLTTITIPSTVTSMGDSIFSASSLTSATLESGITSIPNATFTNCGSLQSVTIPNTVTSIGDGVFMNCSSLESVTIPSSVTTIGFGAFMQCTGLTSVTIENTGSIYVTDFAFGQSATHPGDLKLNGTGATLSSYSGTQTGINGTYT